ncbi:MAG: glucose 1-dehydrogenase [SAR202 cluster bacterium]|jgi:NAD(P)-dependent dehydrogenase (short-subunit alcohol dehydrogenase family)|nr:glucose 1-dehydrogenase [SAR202 cluster bacterium]MDP6300353.1 glucose 1-dehydrogenase [SAR202 cluster bacterium]MDP7103192.1 glucose 1-dehydrogenase [SAR202 cluster bacterium]MDP7224679.1 glucose 1-dehydrogenase [SAR202 cluster bacterium]MDP7414027.1 glucose 1-dehydrogenase [SAR202 cluster bacterium]|tara:strand:+ start:7017 stop:7835 length:819 start_codon:yes stop_codon:yes gene_type:complete
MAEFNDKVAIVTGGALGMGSITAYEFAKSGASVVVADIDSSAGEQRVARMRDNGLSALFLQTDVSVAADCERAVASAVAEFGGVDVLFNNAGIQPPDSYLNVEDTSEETWDKITGVNLKGHFLMSKYAIPEMRKRGGGVIINNASVQGLQSQPLVPAYAASKGGALSLTRQMALDYAPERIRVLAICPGTIDTEMVRTVASQEGGDIDQTLVRYGAGHPIGRIGQGEDIAALVLFLASDAASFMTGSHVVIDGGLMALGAWAGGAGGSGTDG